MENGGVRKVTKQRVLVTGSRSWTDIKTVYNTLTDHWLEVGNFTLVHGACPTGADNYADQWAGWSSVYPGFNVTVETFPADWSQGKKAGPLRNQKMVDAGADICLAFPTDESRGTLDCIRRARAAGIPVKVFHQNPENANFMAEGKKKK
jgi:hypothetical protein